MDSTERGDRREPTLESWKAIARYLQRDVRTVQRWEQIEGLPVHRHRHGKQVTVYAHPVEIDAWRAGRDQPPPSLKRGSPRRLAVIFILAALAATAVINLLPSPSTESERSTPAVSGEIGAESSAADKANPVDLEHAWETYDQFDPSRLSQAEQMFEALAVAAPRDAEPLVGLALVHLSKAFYKLMPSREAYQRAEQLARQALQLDASQGTAKSVLGWVEFMYRWDWDGAEQLFLEGVEVSPDSLWTHWMLAIFYSAMNRPKLALAEIDQALTLKPDSPNALVVRGVVLNNSGRTEDAVAYWEEIGERLGLLRVGEFLRHAYEKNGDYERAVSVAKQLGYPYAERLETRLREEGRTGYWSVLADYFAERIDRFPDAFSYRFAIAAANSGDIEGALAMLERGYHKREATMVYLPVYALEPLYGEPRFRKLVEDMDLQEEFAGRWHETADS